MSVPKVSLLLGTMLLLLTGCVANTGYPAYTPYYSGTGYGYGGGYAHRPYAYAAPAYYPRHHHEHYRPIISHRPIWKKW